MFLRVPTFGFMFFFYVCVTTAAAEEVRVAVAANFLATLNEIITNFQADTSHTILVSSGSSGNSMPKSRMVHRSMSSFQQMPSGQNCWKRKVWQSREAALYTLWGV